MTIGKPMAMTKVNRKALKRIKDYWTEELLEELVLDNHLGMPAKDTILELLEMLEKVEVEK